MAFPSSATDTGSKHSMGLEMKALQLFSSSQCVAVEGIEGGKKAFPNSFKIATVSVCAKPLEHIAVGNGLEPREVSFLNVPNKSSVVEHIDLKFSALEKRIIFWYSAFDAE